ncbi:MAG TPA: AmmeMemoRadiSam system protein B [Vicinamibacteria bacterium]|nr:AmmeMemoRadiSam system protein B [Vicinamibacteria bacterium]
MTGVRRPAVAGSWYPGEAAALEREVDGYLAAVEPAKVPGPLVALISPHAGLRYSGAVAAYAYALLRDRRDLTVVLVGPSHRAAFDGVAVQSRGRFITPLGEIPIDAEAAEALLAAGDVVHEDPRPHRDEHSLEMQLPFLQRRVPGLRLVPLLMGTQSRQEVDELARALARALAGHDALMVASSDLSHYHPAPVANDLDARVVSDVQGFDPESLMDRLESFRGHACGGGPMVAVMKAARERGASRATVLRYADSGDAGERDKSRVVGYLAAALTAPEAA